MQSVQQQYWKGVFWSRSVSPFRSFAVYHQRGWQLTLISPAGLAILHHYPLNLTSPANQVSQLCQWCLCNADMPLRAHLLLLWCTPLRIHIYCIPDHSGADGRFTAILQHQASKGNTHGTCLNTLEDAAPTLFTGGEASHASSGWKRHPALSCLVYSLC